MRFQRRASPIVCLILGASFTVIGYLVTFDAGKPTLDNALLTGPVLVLWRRIAFAR